MMRRVSGAMTAWLVAGRARLAGRCQRDERGDVPGWVMIVVMTAGIVGVLWVAAEDQLRDMLDSALSSVTGD